MLDFEAQCIDYDIMQQAVSVHCPLTRFLAGLYVELSRCSISPLDSPDLRPVRRLFFCRYQRSALSQPRQITRPLVLWDVRSTKFCCFVCAAHAPKWLPNGELAATHRSQRAMPRWQLAQERPHAPAAGTSILQSTLCCHFWLVAFNSQTLLVCVCTRIFCNVLYYVRVAHQYTLAALPPNNGRHGSARRASGRRHHWAERVSHSFASQVSTCSVVPVCILCWIHEYSIRRFAWIVKWINISFYLKTLIVHCRRSPVPATRPQYYSHFNIHWLDLQALTPLIKTVCVCSGTDTEARTEESLKLYHTLIEELLSLILNVLSMYSYRLCFSSFFSPLL